MSKTPPSMPMDITAIRALLPHRYPFLLVDRVVEAELGKRIRCYKAVSGNEQFFQGHFPSYPVMPGVLIVEAIAQVGAVTLLSMDEYAGKIAFFAGIDNVRFKRQVKPGDTLRMEVELKQIRRGIGSGSGVATVNGDIACKGDFMFAISPDPT